MNGLLSYPSTRMKGNPSIGLCPSTEALANPSRGMKGDTIPTTAVLSDKDNNQTDVSVRGIHKRFHPRSQCKII